MYDATYRTDLVPSSDASSARNLRELAVAYALILATLWTSGLTQRLLMLVAVGWVAVTTLWQRPGGEPDGLRPAGLRRSWWIVVVAAGAAAVAVAISSRLGTLHLPLGFARNPGRMWGYLIWSFAQQFLLQDYFFLRLRRVIPNPSVAVAAAAVLFALAHLPNPVLTVATLFWGAAACMLFLRYRDLYSLGLAHAILGLCLAFTVPDALHHQMRVGLGYLTYHPHRTSQLSQPQQPHGVNAGVGNR